LHALLAEKVCGGEGLITEVNVLGLAEGKGEFAVGKVGSGNWGVIEPLENGSVRKKA
jgi:hypothetical protein